MRTSEAIVSAARRLPMAAGLLAALPLAGALLLTGGARAQAPLGSTAVPLGLPLSLPAGTAFDTGMRREESVETFDPVARAQLLARELPLFWSGTYQPFGSPESVPVQMRLALPRSIGQMVDLRGEMRVGEIVTPVQGNLNARSDQVDLLLLRPVGLASLEPGGVFTGLQGLSLAGWQASRLTNPGGRLQLSPQQAPVPPSAAAAPVRGLW